MIPRTKVNYRLPELLRAAWTGEASTRWRDELTRQLTQHLQTSNVLLTASGRGALYLLFRALPQPKVLVPAYTCKAVVEAAVLAGKELLYGECEPVGFNMDPDAAARLMGPDVIVVATHQFGIPCAIRRTVALAHRSGAFVLEDAAAAFGTRVDGALAGSFGDAAIFSFDSTKLITVPLKAGFMIVRDDKLFETCHRLQAEETAAMPFVDKWRYLLLGAILVMLENHLVYRLFHNLRFRWRGRFTDEGPEFKPVLGPFYRQRMAEWQARLAVPQVARLDHIVATRQRLYAAFTQSLAGARTIVLPPADVSQAWACTRYPILIKGDKLDFYHRACRAGVDFAFSFTHIAAPLAFDRAHYLARQVLDPPFYLRLHPTEFNKTVRVLLQIDDKGPEHAVR
jgi:perosamine synthetase